MPASLMLSSAERTSHPRVLLQERVPMQPRVLQPNIMGCKVQHQSGSIEPSSTCRWERAPTSTFGLQLAALLRGCICCYTCRSGANCLHGFEEIKAVSRSPTAISAARVHERPTSCWAGVQVQAVTLDTQVSSGGRTYVDDAPDTMGRCSTQLLPARELRPPDDNSTTVATVEPLSSGAPSKMPPHEVSIIPAAIRHRQSSLKASAQ